MIQILKLRKLSNGKTTDELIKDVYSDSVQELFQSLPQILERIPKSEHYNLFFTPSNCSIKKREFQSNSNLFFDLDGIDTTRLEEYINTFCATLKLKREQTGIVFSGHGLHFYIGISIPIVEKEFFQFAKPHYKAILGHLTKAFTAKGLPFKEDPSVFEPRRIMRLPGTVNRKEGRPDVEARLINDVIAPTDFDLTALSGIPNVKLEDQIDPSYFVKYPKVYNDSIFAGCSFLAHCKEEPAEVTEPEWYAMLSITSRMENGRELSHTLSSGHPGYNAQTTDLKIDQAIQASGPRKCKSIATIHSGCLKCPHFGLNTSPIMLRPPEAIRTESTGFHDIILDAETGRPKIGKPNFLDLRQFFERKHAYSTHAKMVWTWKETHYQEMTDTQIKKFALDHFNPYPLGQVRNEFLDLVQITNPVNSDVWNNGTFGKINLRNGVLDISTMKLSPHTKDLGFKYCMDYDYDPEARAPRYKKFLDDITEGNKVHQDTLLEFCGYAIAGAECTYQKALVLEGEGQNGKSIFIETLQAIAGRQAFSALPFKEMDNPDRRACLDGVLFNITEETPTKMYDTTAFKNLISGGVTSVRKLYKNSYFIRNKAKLIFSCNTMPTTGDTSHGFFRRFLIIPFNRKFLDSDGTRDVNIGEKLKAELPGILNLYLEGFKRLQENKKFTKSEEGDEEIEDYKQATDPVYAWGKARMIPEAGATTTMKDLFADFKVWADEENFDIRFTNANAFGIKLRKLFPKIKGQNKRIEGQMARVAVDVKLMREY